jgi:uncharacterized membrane protein YkoI
MNRSRKLIIAGAAALALGAGGVGIAQAVGGDSDEQATGPEAERAKRAALQEVGGGRIVGVEREDEGSTAWEVEVVRRNGDEVEISLGADLKRVGVESDDDDQGRGDDD